MKIAVIGGGAIGFIFAAKLHAAGNDTVLVTRTREQAQVLRETGITLEQADGPLRVKVPVAGDAATAGSADLVIMAVKSFSTANAMKQHRGLLDENTIVVSVQNGLGNVEAIAKTAGKEKVIAGVTSQGGYVIGPGIMKYAGAGMTYVGEPGGRRSKRLETIAEIFNTAGIATEISDDIDGLIWNKLYANVGLNALSALLHLHNGTTAKIESARSLQIRAVDEAIAVARAKGMKVNADKVHAHVLSVLEVTEWNISSMQMDVMRQRRTEIEKLNGAIVELGRQYEVPTPVNDVLVMLIKAIEESYGKTVPPDCCTV